MRPAGADAAVRAVQVHHATGQEGELLVHLAGTGINPGIERVVRRQLVRHHQAGLLLRYGLAGVEEDRARRHLARVLVELRMAQAQRILRQRLVEQVDDAGESGVG